MILKKAMDYFFKVPIFFALNAVKYIFEIDKLNHNLFLATRNIRR